MSFHKILKSINTILWLCLSVIPLCILDTIISALLWFSTVYIEVMPLCKFVFSQNTKIFPTQFMDMFKCYAFVYSRYKHFSFVMAFHSKYRGYAFM